MLVAEKTSSRTLEKSQEKQRERRYVRTQYRELIDSTSSQQADAVAQADYKVFRDALDKGEELFKHVKRPREAALDTELLSTISQLGNAAIHTISPGFSQYKFTDFVSHLTSKLSDAPSGSTVDSLFDLECKSGLFSHSPHVTFMNGPLHKRIEEQVRKQRKKPQKDSQPPTRAVTAQQLRQHNQEEETTKRFEHVFHYLQDRHEKAKNVKFWDFVSDPQNFSKTVENIFHLSFLVKDGRTKVHENLVIEPSVTPVETEYSQSNVKVRQAVLALTYDDWKDLISQKDANSDVHVPAFQQLSSY